MRGNRYIRNTSARCTDRHIFAPGLCVRAAALLTGALFLFSNTALAYTAEEYAAQEEAQRYLPIESDAYPMWPSGPIVNSRSAILMEAETGTILYEKNIHEKSFPASTTKIMTALLTVENCTMDENVTFSREAVFSIPRDSSNIGMDAGEVITVEQCLYGLLVGSANEVANALGEHVSGSIEGFVEMMNERAKELGCKNTHFVTTNGLQDDDHYTTAYDLALIAQKFFDNENLCKMSSTPRYYIPQSSTQPDEDLYIHSKNKLYENGSHAYEYLVGSKTGYTDVARQTLVSCAQKDGIKLICVVFRAESPHQFDDTVALFDYGFENFKSHSIAASESRFNIDNTTFFSKEDNVFGASGEILYIDDRDYIVLPVTAEFSDAESELVYDEEQDDTLATVQYRFNGIDVGQAKIKINEVQEETITEEFDTSLETEAVSTSKASDSTIFVNVRIIIFRILCVSGGIIFIFVIKAIIVNYRYSKRRNARISHRKRRKTISTFRDMDF